MRSAIILFNELLGNGYELQSIRKESIVKLFPISFATHNATRAEEIIPFVFRLLLVRCAG